MTGSSGPDNRGTSGRCRPAGPGTCRLPGGEFVGPVRVTHPVLALRPCRDSVVSADPDPHTLPVQGEGDGGRYRVDARGALGVQVGEGNTQIIYSYNRLTWTDGVAPPPLAGVSGVVDSPVPGIERVRGAGRGVLLRPRGGRHPGAGADVAAAGRAGLAGGVGGVGSGKVVAAAGGGTAADARGRAGVRAGGGVLAVPGVYPTRAPLEELAVRVAPLAGAERPRCGAGWTPIRPGSPSPRARPPWPAGRAGGRLRTARRSSAAAAAGGRPVRAAVHPMPR